MRLFFVCLLTLCFFAFASTTLVNRRARKLEEVLSELRRYKGSLQDKEQMVPTPPQNNQDCCCLAALTCFRETLRNSFNLPTEHKFYRSLNSTLTKEGLKCCEQNLTTSTCNNCTSHPKQTTNEFFKRFESFIQQGISKLK